MIYHAKNNAITKKPIELMNMVMLVKVTTEVPMKLLCKGKL